MKSEQWIVKMNQMLQYHNIRRYEDSSTLHAMTQFLQLIQKYCHVSFHGTEKKKNLAVYVMLYSLYSLKHDDLIDICARYERD